MEKFQHGGQIYNNFGKSQNFFDFSANINPLGLSENVRQTLIKNFDGVVNYPDPNAIELKSAILQKYNISAENLILLNGAAEFFYLFCNVFRPKKILIPVPSFSEYERAAISSGAEIEFFFTREEENFKIDAEKLLQKNADCLILGRPNNPTGNLISVEEILRLSEKFSVVVDESFIDFLPEKSARNFLSEKIFVVQSLTKIFAIPGLRLGFAVAEKNFAEKLSELPIKIFPPTVNFILIQLESEELAENILQGLRDKKILVRSCENFLGLDGRFLRLAIRSREENNFLLKNLSEIFRKFY